MECDICMIEWDTQIRIPRLLQCGHTFCQNCLLNLLSTATKNNSDFFCPNCMTKHKDISNNSNILSLIKNYNLLRIVEKLENRKTIVHKKSNDQVKDTVANNENESSISHKKKLKLFPYEIPKEKEDKNKLVIKANSYKASNSQNLNFKQIELTDYDAKCKKHGFMINSYVLGTNMLFCNKCIEETNMEVCPLPRVVKDIKKKIDSSKLHICLITNEIKRLYEFFNSYQEEFEKSNKQKIDDLFSYFYKLVSYNYNTASQIFNQCKGEQKTQIDQKIIELKDLESELLEITNLIENIDLSEEGILLKYESQLTDIYERLNTFINYESELSLLTMKVGIKNEFKNNIIQTFQESYFIDVEFANIQGKTPTLKHILQKERFWSCVCGELNNQITEVNCNSCDAFRRYETIPDFYSNPENISEDNLKIAILRRKTEAKIFQELIKETDLLIKEGANFYAVDLEWFLLWKCYVTNDSSEKNLTNMKKKFSINKQIGILPPGPISNSNLFFKNNIFEEKTLRKGLSKNDEYVIVNYKVWNLFFNNYNGGPEIILKKNDDIYIDFQTCSNRNHIPYFEFMQQDYDEDEEITTDDIQNDDQILDSSSLSYNNVHSKKSSNTKQKIVIISNNKSSKQSKTDILNNEKSLSKKNKIQISINNKHRKSSEVIIERKDNNK